MLDICMGLMMQSTILQWRKLGLSRFVGRILGALCASMPSIVSAAAGPDLASLLTQQSAIVASGTLSVQGSMSISGIPFDATLHADTILVTTGSPFGMTTSSVYAAQDTVVVLNFLTRQAYNGNPASAEMSGILPVPLAIDDIRALVKGLPPGDLSGFEFQSPRDNGQLLFRRRDSSTIEFALVDSASRTLRQYQRKGADGRTILNVTFGSFRVVDGVHVPFGVKVTANADAETIQFQFNDVRLTVPSQPLRPLAIPPSFTRLSLR